MNTLNTTEDRLAKIESFVIYATYVVLAAACPIYGFLQVNTMPIV